jgi:hypothetical protein
MRRAALEARLCNIFCDIRTLDRAASGRIFGFLAYLGEPAWCGVVWCEEVDPPF